MTFPNKIKNIYFKINLVVSIIPITFAYQLKHNNYENQKNSKQN